MFGKFVFSFLFGLQVFAAQKGTITAETADIYESADFDSPVIATVQKGEIYDISDNTSGPFYRIRLKDKKLGWISDIDIKPGKSKIKKAEPPKALESHQDQKNLENKFIVLRYQGPRLEILNWQEKFSGKRRRDQLNLLGWAWTGTSTLLEGPHYFDSSITAGWEAPDYYKKVTGLKSTGTLLRVQTALITPHELGENFLYHYGLGGVLTYTNFKAGKSYDDLNWGLFIPLGIAYRLKDWSFQAWYRYYFENNQTSSLGLGVGWKY